MSDTHFKDAICTVSTRNLDPSIITPEINVAFMSDSSSKLSKYIQDAVGVVLADDYVVSPYVTSAASMSGVAVIIRATGRRQKMWYTLRYTTWTRRLSLSPPSRSWTSWKAMRVKT